jgi:hypothetical protein
MEVRPLTTADAEAIAAWRYPGRYSTYDIVHQILWSYPIGIAASRASPWSR